MRVDLIEQRQRLVGAERVVLTVLGVLGVGGDEAEARMLTVGAGDDDVADRQLERGGSRLRPGVPEERFARDAGVGAVAEAEVGAHQAAEVAGDLVGLRCDVGPQTRPVGIVDRVGEVGEVGGHRPHRHAGRIAAAEVEGDLLPCCPVRRGRGHRAEVDPADRAGVRAGSRGGIRAARHVIRSVCRRGCGSRGGPGERERGGGQRGPDSPPPGGAWACVPHGCALLRPCRRAKPMPSAARATGGPGQCAPALSTGSRDRTAWCR